MTVNFALLYWYCMARVSEGLLQEERPWFHPSHGFPVSFLARPDLFRNLYALHDCRRALAHARDTAQGFPGELGWLTRQSCPQYYVTSGTSRCFISGQPSESHTVLLTQVSCTGFTWQLWEQETEFWNIFPGSTEEMDRVSHYIVSIDFVG